MEIVKTQNSDVTIVSLVGRLDTSTAPQLETELSGVYADAPALAFDFSQLDYISSAGLRVILSIQKSMSAKGGTLTLKKVCDDVMEVFDMTGFSSFLTIEA